MQHLHRHTVGPSHLALQSHLATNLFVDVEWLEEPLLPLLSIHHPFPVSSIVSTRSRGSDAQPGTASTYPLTPDP
jgi:hypothetical protein